MSSVLNTENEPLLIVGLMSGTSVDGIDVALVRTNGQQLNCLQRSSSVYKESTRQSILQVYNDPVKFLRDTVSVDALSVAIAQDHALAVQQIVEVTDVVTQAEVQLLGFHGQTLLHKPDEGVSVQLGCAKTLSNVTGVNTVHSFRQADLLDGGQGAPLAPIYHQTLMQQAALELPAVMLNIGGVANLSYWDGDLLMGFDTGPGNGLLDQYMQQHLNCPFDENGALAAQGVVHMPTVLNCLSDPYFDGIKPKSLDRASFNRLLTLTDLQNMSSADAMATLTAVTVMSVRRALEQFSEYPKQLIVCGGGQHNQYMVSELGKHLSVTVNTADELQLAGDHIEAELMALLAARYHYQLPSTFPTTTGVTKPCIAGEMQPTSSA